jgi:hypothetical protein
MMGKVLREIVASFLFKGRKIWQSCSLSLSHFGGAIVGKQKTATSRVISVMLVEQAALYFTDLPADICFRFQIGRMA